MKITHVQQTSNFITKILNPCIV